MKTEKPAGDERRRGAAAKIALALLLVPAVPAGFTAWLHPRAPDWRVLGEPQVAIERVSVSSARGDYADALWVDARPADARAAGVVPGSVALNEDDWETGFAALAEKWDGRQPLVVYCGGDSCHASEAVALRLRRELGFERIVVLQGGWEAWCRARALGGQP